MSETLPDTQPAQPQTEPEQQENALPTIQELSFQQCGNCTTGVLQVLRYDPEALHEQGQDLSGTHQNPSGGAYETLCGFCGQRVSHSLAEAAQKGAAA